MTCAKRVVSPRITPPPNYGLRAILVLLALAAVGVATTAAFVAGTRFERQASEPMSARISALERERDALNDEVSDLKQRGIVLERTQQIDREAKRTAAEQLKEAQDERLAVEKEVSYLRRLIQEGGGGILQPKDFSLTETGKPGEFGYSFTIRQLIQDFGQSAGSVQIKVVGTRDGKETSFGLDELKGSEPTRHKMKFKHFQTFEGLMRLPDDFEPESLVIEIEPTTANLIPVTETFPWSLE
jgi:hypothetical protein